MSNIKKNVDVANLIRSIIFLVAGLVVLLFPERVATWQSNVLIRLTKNLPKKYRYSDGELARKRLLRDDFIMGIVSLIIAAVLFVFAISR